MRIINVCLVVSMALASAVAHSEETFQAEKVKTGILPSGGFYKVYSVACSEDRTAAIASVNRNKRWCMSYEGQMNCFSRVQEASARACMSDTVASADSDFTDADKFQ